ncbi:MAG: topoisomerase [Actinomycetota bacterium]|nr:topoisomerase [Actinomycetota bacterium]
MPRTKKISCSGPGILRRPRGRGFEFIDGRTGRRLADPHTMARIRDLGIPPAWKDVWICTEPMGHIQAWGTDAAGRKQYIYHQVWRQQKDRQKFDRMLRFAAELPAMRAKWIEDLQQEGLGREKVLACAALLLDRAFFRIGGESYAEQNESYGLATLQKKHVQLLGDNWVSLNYKAKSGKMRVTSIPLDPAQYRVIAELKKRRGGSPELLAYKQDRRWIDVKSIDINQYLKQITGVEVSAKDFRTWNATVMAAAFIAPLALGATSETSKKRAISTVVKDVANYLGNTPAVCRSSYIDPRVFDRFRSGWTILGAIDSLGEAIDYGDVATHGAIEEAVVDLLTDNKASPALEKIAS